MTTAVQLREAFPLTPPGARIPHSTDKPSGAATRPWGLRFARTPDSTGAVTVPPAFYDTQLQVNISSDGGLLTCMANTHTPTIPDGSITNPPPLDEGPKD